MTYRQASVKPLRVGIALTSNVRGGPQKVSAVAALDLARNGHQVELFIPVMPYHFYLVELNGSLKRWLKRSLPYIKAWAVRRKFVFQEIWDRDEARGNISVHFVLVRPSKNQLQGLDCLILHSIAQVYECQDRYPQIKQIYLLHHPEEHNHSHGEEFKAIRSAFEGKILAISPFTAGEIGNHVPDAPVVPDPVSSTFWGQRHNFDPTASRRDILFFWKEDAGLKDGKKIAKSLQSIRPETTLTIWCRNQAQATAAGHEFPGANIVDNLTENELCCLYLNHSFLLFPYTYEGFGMPPIEGLACGCIPVLHPQVGAAELYARDGENSLHSGGKIEDIACRMAAVLDNQKTLVSMRKAAPQSLEPFSPDGYGLRILKAAGVLCATVTRYC